MKIDYVLSKLRLQKEYTGNNNRIQAYCPAHEDKNASLSIAISNDRILLFCHAGCKIEDILKNSGLTYSDLFSDKTPSNVYQYKDKDGNLVYEKLKYKTPEGKTFRQRRLTEDGIVDNLDGISKIPYNLPHVIDSIKSKSPVVFVEGEKDAETAELLGYTGTTFGGASDWKDEYKYYFKNAHVILIPDKDDPGLKNATKIKNSLSTVCKSLKLIILPDGKDLTEWVESGNSDFDSLINSGIESVKNNGIPEPSMDLVPTGYKFDWNGLGLKIVIDRIKGEDDAEISIYNNGNELPDYISGIKLLSISHKSSLVRALKPMRNIDWDVVINQVTTKALNNIRHGNDVVMLDSEIGSQRPEYLLQPMFIKNAPSIVYADRSSGKSLFLIMIDLILSLPWWDNNLGLKIKDTEKHTVLFLDWENDANITGWQKECILRGTEFGWCDLPYLKCDRPLFESVNYVLDKIGEVGADVIIIDSLGMAVGDDLNLTKPAFAFFSALRQLPVTPIIIGHTSKDLNNKRKTVYGNAYYENEARSIWEASKDQQPGSNEMLLTLFQRKNPPFTGQHEPLAWKFIFEGDKTFIESTTPDTDKRSSIDKEPTEEDIALSVLMDSLDGLRPKDIVLQSNNSIKSTHIGVILTRLLKKEFITRDEHGFYFYNENHNKLL